MTAQAGRAGRIKAGDRVVVEGRPRVVLGASGPLIRFAADDGSVEETAVAELVGSGRMRLQPRGPGGHPPARTGLAGLPPEAVERARSAAPGELMEIDSTPLDVLVLLDNGETTFSYIRRLAVANPEASAPTTRSRSRRASR